MHDGSTDSDSVPMEGVVVRKRRKGIYILPNLFTLAALFGGFFSVVMAMNQRFDMAAMGQELQPHLSARLKRVSPEEK